MSEENLQEFHTADDNLSGSVGDFEQLLTENPPTEKDEKYEVLQQMVCVEFSLSLISSLTNIILKLEISFDR